MKQAHARFSTIVIIASLAFLVFGSCKKPSIKPDVKEANPAWSTIIQGHTEGLVSRKEKIQIAFRNDLFSKEDIGKSAAEFLEVSPRVNGLFTIVDTRQLAVIPDPDLAQGQFYLVRIKGNRLPHVPPGIGDFEFVFQTIKQDFEVSLGGLSSNPLKDAELELTGSLSTADVDTPDAIKQVVSAQLDGKNLPLEWSHDPFGKTHGFKITSINRTEKSTKLIVSWSGASIKAERTGQQEIEIPAVDVFKITGIQPIQAEQQYVAVYFSDNIDARQQLRGLVKVDQANFSIRVEGNTIKIYPEQRFVGKVTVTVQPGVRNTKNKRLEEAHEETVLFTSQSPQVRFTGKGVILPNNAVLSIPFEAINVHSVQVTAFRVFEDNMAQFLQTNRLSGSNEMGRVGRFLWRKTISLPALTPDQWQRYDLDATSLVKQEPGSLIRLALSINRGNSNYSCSEEERAVSIKPEPPLTNNEDLYVQEASSWDYAEDYYNTSYDGSNWNDRNDPCKDAYYTWGQGVKAERNFLASNIGLLAKMDQTGRVTVAATNIQTGEPMSGVTIRLRNFQNQDLVSGSTDKAGLLSLQSDNKPFYISAQRGTDIGYLKMNAGSALATSHFDVGGDAIQSGVKGTLYGERGVWRPGDKIYLVFVLEDKGRLIPQDHPVTIHLSNPRGQVIQTLTNNKPVGNFYAFLLETTEDAPTGTWSAKATLGNRVFSKPLKIETVIPNRLKIELGFASEVLHRADMPAVGSIFSQWLHGARAANLKADVTVRLNHTATKFSRFTDFMFDDPAREFTGEEETLFEGRLDQTGNIKFNFEIKPGPSSPGMMRAQFRTRVFEESGAFSSSFQSKIYHPYKTYVGLKLPKGDKTRGMILTDIKHPVEIGTLNSKGEPVSIKKVKVSLYKVDWRWWWDKSADSLARHFSSRHYSPILENTIETKDGKGLWEFEIKHPAWGRYLLRACDEEGGHCSGQTVYIDWPGWAARAQEESGPGANVLQFYSDKNDYLAGEKAVLHLPEATEGRALLSVENGSRILETRWLDIRKGRSKVELPITAAMTPNVFVSITLLQPHTRSNDRPLRLYGIIPLGVKDPATVLKPSVEAADEWQPESKVEVRVSEQDGRPMTYTLAVVDEGLLGLTDFKTPDLHSIFYSKEALGVSTWDLFDEVVGSYSAELERLLALGGDGALDELDKKQEERRFPPVVRFYGPFQLTRKESRLHEVHLPAYVGAVRVMVVAGQGGAYGKAEKTVLVREDLTLLTTLPRVIGPDEEITVPVSVFVSNDKIKDVQLSITADKFFTVLGNAGMPLTFSKQGEKMGFFRLKSNSDIGQGKIVVTASHGQRSVKSETFLSVRSPNPVSVRYVDKQLDKGGAWTANIVPHGLPGTNEVSLEVSAIPPLNLERRLSFLVQYPHGCVEQVTSAVFPQLYLPRLLTLSETRKNEIEVNVNAGINRLRGFQVPNGAFSYWPGGWGGESAGQANTWVTNYVGHFLLEAKRLGYFVAPQVLSDWMKFQSTHAQAWTGTNEDSTLDQAYRLMTLAMAGKPELGAMNRLRESANLPNLARWHLAAAYHLAGVRDVADDIARKANATAQTYKTPGATFASSLRDLSIILDSLAIMNKSSGKDLIDQISNQLSSQEWHSTQSTAYALMAVSRYFNTEGSQGKTKIEVVRKSGNPVTIETSSPISIHALANVPLKGEDVIIKNMGENRVFAAIVTKGVPAAGSEIASEKGLSLAIRYQLGKGGAVDVANLAQGTDIASLVTIKNTSSVRLENIAFTHMAPSGWEIQNPRMSFDESPSGPQLDYQDIRDDRVNSYFSLEPNASITLETKFTASYLGRFYLPGLYAEAMYDASKSAQTKGRWINVIKQ